MPNIARYLPILDWGRRYDRRAFGNDMIAAVIVTIMLIPQSLAYAMLAGLPPEMGLYASILPIMLYAVFGTSRALAVGPVAVVSLMTAASVGQVAAAGTAGYIAAAITLAGLSGLMLVVLGLFRMGFVANFLSHPVIAGFITASGILIAASQLGPLLGIRTEGHTLPEVLWSLWQGIGGVNWITAAIGAGALAFLWFVRARMKALLTAWGVKPGVAAVVTKVGPVAAIVVTTLAVTIWNLDDRGVAVVGVIPQSLPPFTLPSFDLTLIQALFVPALLISVIGFVESVSVGQTLAAKKRQRIDPNQELIGLGAANLGAAFTGGFPVTGGFARSVVNYDAGAETPAAGAFTAVGLAVAALMLTPLIHDLPKATLAATIIVAVLSLVDLGILRRTWDYATSDFAAVATTIGLTLLVGVEAGVTAGVVLSLALFLYKTSRPHIAEVGLVPGTEHFRNIRRHTVATQATLVTIRIDESLYFANARFLEDHILARITPDCGVTDLVLMCSAVNEIDMSALESLEAINLRLRDMGVRLHLSEVKGPVMDKIKTTHFLDDLTGEVFLSQYAAWEALSGVPPLPRAAE